MTLFVGRERENTDCVGLETWVPLIVCIHVNDFWGGREQRLITWDRGMYTCSSLFSYLIVS